jgi:hypothetical protein
MKNRTFLAMILVGFALGGCTSGPFRIEGKQLECASTKCEVQVSVSCFFSICSASVDYETVVVRKNRDVEIIWQLRDAAYTFPENGILFLEAKEEFRCAVGPDRQRFLCRVNASRPGKYKYTVNVRGPRTVPPLDPWVVID